MSLYFVDSFCDNFMLFNVIACEFNSVIERALFLLLGNPEVCLLFRGVVSARESLWMSRSQKIEYN